MVEMPDHTLTGPDGPIRLVDVFDGRSQLIVYNHMWSPGETYQCPGCTGYTTQFSRLDYLADYDAPVRDHHPRPDRGGPCLQEARR